MLGYKVFSDSKASQRAVLGERVTGWLRANPGIDVLQTWVRQSSDREWHCQTIVVQYEDHGRALVEVPRPEAPVPSPRRTRRHVCACNPGAGYICSPCASKLGRGVRDA